MPLLAPARVVTAVELAAQMTLKKHGPRGHFSLQTITSRRYYFDEQKKR